MPNLWTFRIPHTRLHQIVNFARADDHFLIPLEILKGEFTPTSKAVQCIASNNIIRSAIMVTKGNTAIVGQTIFKYKITNKNHLTALQWTCLNDDVEAVNNYANFHCWLWQVFLSLELKYILSSPETVKYFQHTFRRYIMNFSIQYEVICKDFYDSVTFLHCFLWAAQQPENINTNVLKEILILSRYIHSTETPFCRHRRFPSVLKSITPTCFLNKEIETFSLKSKVLGYCYYYLKQTKTLG